MNPTPHAAAGGIPVWLPTLNEFRAAVQERMLGAPQAVVRLHTLNPEMLVRARVDKDYARVLGTTSWSVVDGVGLSLVLRARGIDVPARICGSDLIHDLAKACAEANRPLFILGGEPGVREAAARNLGQAYPGLAVAGFSPSYGPSVPDEEAEIARMLTELRPAVVALCLGAPRQEKWMLDHQDLLNAAGVRIAAGLGGTVDFLAGKVPRAPVFLRKIGMEWAYRLYREPARWRRQLVLPGFALRGLLPGYVSRTPVGRAARGTRAALDRP